MSRQRRRHDCQRLDVLAKTLELSHEGVIMPRGSGAQQLRESSQAASLPHQDGAATTVVVESQRFAPESCNEDAALHTPLRHTRVRSVRVTVEPQVYASYLIGTALQYPATLFVLEISMANIWN